MLVILLQDIKLVQQVLTFCCPLRTGNLDQAKAAYIAFRPYYEEIEVLCESFPDIDSDIDARPYAFVSGDASCDADDPFARGQVYQGSHMVEALLYRSAHASRCTIICDSVFSKQTLSAII